MLSLCWLELENKENEARTKCCCVCSHSALAGPFSEIEQHAEYEVYRDRDSDFVGIYSKTKISLTEFSFRLVINKFTYTF